MIRALHNAKALGLFFAPNPPTSSPDPAAFDLLLAALLAASGVLFMYLICGDN